MNPQTPTLAELIELASGLVEKWFKKAGTFTPQYVAMTADQKCMFRPFPTYLGKEAGLQYMRDLFLREDVVAYVFADEAWLVRTRELSDLSNAPLSQHPARQEVIMLSAESEQEAAIFGIRNIIRPKHGKPYLGPLKLEAPTNVTGNMTGMLARRTTLQ